MIHNSNSGNSIDLDKTASKSILIKSDAIDLGNGINTYVQLTANQTNAYTSSEGWSEVYEESSNLYYSRYSAYKDINLSQVSFDGGPVTISIANVQSQEGWMRNYGNYGAWSIVIVYDNSNETLKNISVHTGYKSVYNDTLDFTLSGFITPLTSSVSSSISVFAVEGEKSSAFGDDSMKITDNAGVLQNVSDNLNYPNQSNNIFDSTITNIETKTPSIANTMGIDIDTFEGWSRW
ncbi:MAG: hypothetical protein Q9M43_01295 [Sulfurimonas sp.]|nr:hypothetical protein [Sulfurimonas sp.]